MHMVKTKYFAAYLGGPKIEPWVEFMDHKTKLFDRIESNVERHRSSIHKRCNPWQPVQSVVDNRLRGRHYTDVPWPGRQHLKKKQRFTQGVIC